jgi:Na+/melibiose symporter-like transporter
MMGKFGLDFLLLSGPNMSEKYLKEKTVHSAMKTSNSNQIKCFFRKNTFSWIVSLNMCISQHSQLAQSMNESKTILKKTTIQRFSTQLSGSFCSRTILLPTFFDF